MKTLKIRKFADKSKPREEIRDDAGNVIGLKPWPLARVVVQDQPPLDHVISWQYVAQAQAEGWMVIADDVLEIRASNVTVRYRIVEPPGRYTDPLEPAGYRVSNQFTLRLIDPL